MEYKSKTVRCNEPGLTQEQALASLYSHYGEDIRVASVKRRADAWVVTIQQKVAEFPPPKGDDEGGESEAPEPKSPPSDEGPADDAGSPDGPPSFDGPPSGDDDGGPEKKDPQAEILHLLTEIADKLGIGGGLHDKLPPEGEHPGAMPPGPDVDPMGGDMGGDMPGGPVDMPAPPKKPTKLKPGEVLPNQTPVGAPAFASTKATFEVESGKVDPRVYQASQAQAELEANFVGYKVKQMTFDRTASVYRALLSIH